MHRDGTAPATVLREAVDRPFGRLADVAAWLGCLALVGFACDPDTLWFPVRLAGWAGDLLLA